jgi:hypothetical protein
VEYLALVWLLPETDSPRTRPIVGSKYSCPVYFDDVEELAGSGWDARMSFDESEGPIVLGGEPRRVRVAFLSHDRVAPFVRIGGGFRLWEGGTIGFGQFVDGR